MAFAGVAEQVWKLPEGTHEHCGFRAVRNPNSVLLFVSPKSWYGRQDKLLSTNGSLNQLDKKADILHIVAYPNPKHHEAFAEQSKLNRQGGYSEDYPEAIGTLSIGIDPRNAKGDLQVNYVQSHMAGSENITMRKWTNEHSPKSGLNRSLKTRYAGWRERAFRELIRLAKQKNKAIMVTKSVSELKKQFEKNDQLLRDIRAAAKKEGVEIEDSEKELKILSGSG
jgi:hypothetical protein